MDKRLINPYTLYVVSFGGALLLYPLNWSGYYPPLQASLIIFLLVSFLLSVVAAKKFIKGMDLNDQSLPTSGVRQIGWISGLLYALWIVEFVHAGGMPLYLMLAAKSFDYRTFGVPTLHVFLVTFSSFYVSYLFHVFLHSRKRIMLIFYLINLLPALLILNRGMLLMNLSTSLFIYLYSAKSIERLFSVRKLPLLAISLVSLSLLFGVLGTLRVSHVMKHFYVPSLVYEVGKATPSFRNSIIPSEFFWGYLYFTSPMANLQLTTTRNTPEISVNNLLQWGTNEVMLDAASKRINAYYGLSKRENARVAPHLNASTVYAGSFAYAGWYGMGLMNLVLLGLPFLFRRLLNAESKYYITGMALINTLYLFLIFDNMIAFSGFSFQLVYPLLFSWLDKPLMQQFGSWTR